MTKRDKMIFTLRNVGQSFSIKIFYMKHRLPYDFLFEQILKIVRIESFYKMHALLFSTI